MPTPTAIGLLGGAALLVAAATTPPAFTLQDPAITESSGLAASTRHPGVYWTHNDSSPDGSPSPYLYAVDGETGETLATITLAGDGVAARDVEAVSVGPDDTLYVGDIGDNINGWEEVWIYRLPEPEVLEDATVTPTVHPVRYEDGPRDAEALMVHPVTGRVHVVTKSEDGDGALYAAPASGLAEDGVTTLTRVTGVGLWVTDGAFSPDGTRLFLRGYFASQMYAWPAPDGPPEPIEREVMLPLQQQGESVTFTPDGTALMLGSEGESSTVEPAELAGQLLPDSAREQQQEQEREQDRRGDQAATDEEEDDDGLSAATAATLLAGVLVILILRRVVLRRRSPR